MIARVIRNIEQGKSSHVAPNEAENAWQIHEKS